MAGLWKWMDLHDLDQAVINGEAMANVVIGNNGSGHVTYDLMHNYQNSIAVLRVKFNRLDVRIDLAPLLFPVCANLIQTKVQRRVAEYPPLDRGAKEQWFTDWFLPTLHQIRILPLRWEALIVHIKEQDPIFGVELGEFYARAVS
jgi:hypothetical protein